MFFYSQSNVFNICEKYSSELQLWLGYELSAWTAGYTGKVNEVNDAGFLAFTLLSLDKLVECDGDDSVSTTAGRVHVRRCNGTTCRAYIRIYGYIYAYICVYTSIYRLYLYILSMPIYTSSPAHNISPTKH